jgi:hypothetical protein
VFSLRGRRIFAPFSARSAASGAVPIDLCESGFKLARTRITT